MIVIAKIAFVMYNTFWVINMKKLLKSMLIIILAVCMLVTITGCGKKEEKEEPKKAEISKVDANADTTETTTEISMGEWNGNTYTNNYLGLKFNLPTGWTHYSDEEIAEMMNISEEVLKDEEQINIELAKLTSVYYLAASDPETLDNVMLMTEKPIMDVTTELYLNTLKTQLENLNSINYEVGETGKEKIGNREFDTLTTKATTNGVTMIQKYYIYKSGDHFIDIIVTSNSGEQAINKIIKSFE